ncbi:uncharacterized protein LOC124256812 isoform X2 [Haliotis rubra]|uniref:uncharacterized protein LOC124256812 isoform X2 n=1 Tax=Haliotis rubra TaxID=36100 RepID=UPI001EE5354D|nr:uncharacterized protein LOC124256812 isoform X2 [Haliotis rubra]
MPIPRKRLQANSGGEVTQADKPGSKPLAQPPREGDSQDGEISDADYNSSTVQPERPSDPVTYRDIIQIYRKPALEIMVLVIVFYLLYRSSPDNTERALLDVLNEKCGKSPSETKTCIQRLLSSKTSCKVPEDVPKTKQVTPDCSHLESEYKNLEHTVHDLNKWTEGIESVFKDPSQMSEPLRTLKDHHRHLQTMSSAGKGNDLADVTQVEADVKTIAEANEAISKTLHETNTNLAEVRSTLAETRTNLTETNTKVGKQEGRINQQDEKQRNVTENVIPDIRSKMGQIQGESR